MATLSGKKNPTGSDPSPHSPKFEWTVMLMLNMK